MFNLDDDQLHIIRSVVGSAFTFWLLSQIADSNSFARFWNQAAILTIGAGAVRVCILEGAKPKGSRRLACALTVRASRADASRTRSLRTVCAGPVENPSPLRDYSAPKWPSW